MNCEVAQRQLLAAEDPDQEPDALRAHLAYCGECREWQARLVRIERQVPRLPVPRSRAGERLVRRFAGPAQVESVPVESGWAASEILASPPELATARPMIDWARTHARSLAAAAAVISVCSLAGWWLQDVAEAPMAPTPPEKPAPPPLLGSLLRQDLRLATAGSAGERVAILADVADDIHHEIRLLVQEGPAVNVDGLARLYERVIREGIMIQAQALPQSNRRHVLHLVASRLEVAARNAQRLMKEVPVPAATSLGLVANAALDGQHRLNALELEGKS
jgi:hypothetical protein